LEPPEPPVVPPAPALEPPEPPVVPPAPALLPPAPPVAPAEPALPAAAPAEPPLPADEPPAELPPVPDVPLSLLPHAASDEATKKTPRTEVKRTEVGHESLLARWIPGPKKTERAPKNGAVRA
jgi:hypothetical protein